YGRTPATTGCCSNASPCSCPRMCCSAGTPAARAGSPSRQDAPGSGLPLRTGTEGAPQLCPLPLTHVVVTAPGRAIPRSSYPARSRDDPSFEGHSIEDRFLSALLARDDIRMTCANYKHHDGHVSSDL